jgi:hypothetical protein
MFNRVLNRRVVFLVTSIVRKKIIVCIWYDAEFNALSNENKLGFQYYQKLADFRQILSHYEYT